MKIPTFEELIEIAPIEIKNILEEAKSIPQSAKWHPEAPGDDVPHNVYKHIKIVYERAMHSSDINLVMAAFFHDLGKVATTALNKQGGWSAHGHEEVSSRLVEKYKKWIGENGAKWFEVYQIVKEHMRIKKMDEMKFAKQKVLLENPLYDKFIEFSNFDNMQTLTEEEMKK